MEYRQVVYNTMPCYILTKQFNDEQPAIVNSYETSDQARHAYIEQKLMCNAKFKIFCEVSIECNDKALRKLLI